MTLARYPESRTMGMVKRVDRAQACPLTIRREPEGSDPDLIARRIDRARDVVGKTDHPQLPEWLDRVIADLEKRTRPRADRTDEDTTIDTEGSPATAEAVLAAFSACCLISSTWTLNICRRFDSTGKYLWSPEPVAVSGGVWLRPCQLPGPLSQ